MRSLIGIAAILVMGCRAAMPEPQPPEGAQAGSTATFRIVRSGSYGQAAAAPSRGQDTPIVEIAASSEQYQVLWDKHIGGAPGPAIDFSKETAVFLLLGLKPTGGYGIEPRSVKVSGSSATVSAEVSSPGPDSIVTMAFTSPFAVIAVSEPRLESAEWVGGDGRVVTRSEKRPVR